MRVRLGCHCVYASTLQHSLLEPRPLLNIQLDSQSSEMRMVMYIHINIRRIQLLLVVRMRIPSLARLTICEVAGSGNTGETTRKREYAEKDYEPQMVDWAPKILPLNQFMYPVSPLLQIPREFPPLDNKSPMYDSQILEIHDGERTMSPLEIETRSRMSRKVINTYLLIPDVHPALFTHADDNVQQWENNPSKWKKLWTTEQLHEWAILWFRTVNISVDKLSRLKPNHAVELRTKAILQLKKKKGFIPTAAQSKVAELFESDSMEKIESKIEGLEEDMKRIQKNILITLRLMRLRKLCKTRKIKLDVGVKRDLNNVEDLLINDVTFEIYIEQANRNNQRMAEPLTIDQWNLTNSVQGDLYPFNVQQLYSELTRHLRLRIFNQITAVHMDVIAAYFLIPKRDGNPQLQPEWMDKWLQVVFDAYHAHQYEEQENYVPTSIRKSAIHILDASPDKRFQLDISEYYSSEDELHMSQNDELETLTSDLLLSEYWQNVLGLTPIYHAGF